MINRAALIFRLKQPMVDWINSVHTSATAGPVTLERANSENTVYLISDDDVEVADEWLKLNFEAVFASELEAWYTDTSLWPSPLTLERFLQWFEMECHSMVFDTVGEAIIEDGEGVS